MYECTLVYPAGATMVMLIYCIIRWRYIVLSVAYTTVLTAIHCCASVEYCYPAPLLVLR